MKNISAHIVGLLICAFGLLPPIDFRVTAPGEYFPWIFLGVAFCGFYLLFLKVNLFVKLIPIFGLMNCFFSSAPLLSFLAYVSLVACCYFYILCTMIKNYTPVFNMLICLFLLNIFIFFMQYIGHDPLLNFTEKMCYGIAGQHQQSASFMVILTAAILPRFNAIVFFTFIVAFLCNSLGAFICATFGLLSFITKKWNIKFFIKIFIILFIIFCSLIFITGKFNAYFSMTGGRLGVWVSALKLSLNHPITGFGIGTFKTLFPALGGMDGFPWKTTHNCWIQIFFEMGLIGLSGAVYIFYYLMSNLIELTKRAIFKDLSFACIAGLLMIGTNMLFHFPTRQLNCILIIIFVLSYAERVVQNGIRQT